MSISVQSDVFAALDRHVEAAQTAIQALQFLLPFVERYPETYGSQARKIGADVAASGTRHLPWRFAYRSKGG
jgi:hypothetical protein